MHVLQSRVLVRPSDFDTAVAFYENSIGLVRYREWGRPGHRGVVFFLGGGYLELTETGVDSPVRGVRLWLQVADVGRVHSELQSRGVAVEQPPERKPWGLIEMTVPAPDGLTLVVVETPPDHPLRRDTRS